MKILQEPSVSPGDAATAPPGLKSEGQSGSKTPLSPIDLDRVIEMAWEDRTPFEAIAYQFGLSEAAVKEVMQDNLRSGSYRNWRARVTSSTTKHRSRRAAGMMRFRSNLQRAITSNKISKRR